MVWTHRTAVRLVDLPTPLADHDEVQSILCAMRDDMITTLKRQRGVVVVEEVFAFRGGPQDQSPWDDVPEAMTRWSVQLHLLVEEPKDDPPTEMKE